MPATYKTAPNVVQLSLNGVLSSGNKVTNIWHYQASQAPTESQCESLADAFILNWQIHMLPVTCTDYDVTGIDWLVLTTTDSASGHRPPATGQSDSGTDARSMATSNTSVLIHKNAGAIGRRARNGRCYLVAVPEAELLADGTLQPLYLDSVQNAADGFYAVSDNIDVSGASMVMAQPHWFSTNKPPIESGGVWPATSVTVVQGLEVDVQAATQRRRMRR